MCDCSFVILENAFCFLLNPLLVRTWVLLINNCGDFSKNFLVAEKLQCKVSYHLEISSLLLMSAEDTETLTSVFLKLCFLGFVHHHNEFFFSYLWSFIHKFTSFEDIQIRADEEITPKHY